ncbi:MAG TPA: hypothetical protein VHG08_21520 [Longimicrobium sp.]|nr:hypothetical protein [Longimicrobium sp.]
MIGRSIFTAAAFALAAAGCVPGGAASGPAPREQVISRAEIRASEAANAYDLVQRLRPDWLLLAGDDPAAAGQILVVLDGRPLGDVRALRGVRPQGLAWVRLQSPAYVRERFPRRAAEGVRGAIVLHTASPPEHPTARWAASAGAGIAAASLAHGVERGARAEGVGQPEGFRWTDPGTRTPLAVYAAARYRVRPRVSVGADVQHTRGAWFGGYRRRDEGTGTVSVTASGTELTLQAMYGGTMRLGVGPAVRVVRWDWRGGECQCEAPQRNTSSALGVAGSAGAAFPRSSRVFVDVSLRARWYPSQRTGAYQHVRSLDAGGLVVTPSAGVGIRF